MFLFFLIFAQGLNWQQAHCSCDNGLTPNRRHSIIGTNDGFFYLCLYASIDHQLMDTRWLTENA